MNKLKEVLDEQGRRQTWLCQKIGRTMTAVNSWYHNKTQPSITMLFEIAEALNVEARELLASNEEFNNHETLKTNDKKA